MTTVAERVAAGMAFLDQVDPDWWKADVTCAINLHALDLGDNGKCVLGQRCPLEYREEDGTGDYRAWSAALSGVNQDDWTGADNWAAPLGFQCQGPYSSEDYEDLTAEWKRVILERRAAS